MRVYSLGIVGESNYQPAIRECRVGEMVELIEEPDNPYDSEAVRVESSHGETIGYVPRDSWLIRVIVHEEKDVAARIKGIGSGKGSTLGVVLDVAVGADVDDFEELPPPVIRRDPIPPATDRRSLPKSKPSRSAGIIGAIFKGLFR